MPSELSGGIFIVGKKRKKIALKAKSPAMEGQRLRVAQIHYVSPPDAESRLSRAVDILLGSAVRDLEVGINAKEEEEAPQDSPLTEAMERKDESQSSGEKARTPPSDS